MVVASVTERSKYENVLITGEILCTTQQPLCPGSDRETCLSSVWGRAEPCWRGRLHHSMCQPCCQWDCLENTALSLGAGRHPSLGACSEMPHPCPTGEWARNARVKVWEWSRERKALHFPAPDWKGIVPSLTKLLFSNQTIKMYQFSLVFINQKSITNQKSTC